MCCLKKVLVTLILHRDKNVLKNSFWKIKKILCKSGVYNLNEFGKRITGEGVIPMVGFIMMSTV